MTRDIYRRYNDGWKSLLSFEDISKGSKKITVKLKVKRKLFVSVSYTVKELYQSLG